MLRQLSALARTTPDYAAARHDDCAVMIEIAEQVASGARCDVDTAVDAARKLMGCYRARDFLDPEMFTTALVANLVRYPAPVVKLTCCPVFGLARNQKFPPALAEVVEHMDAVVERIKTHAGVARKALARREVKAA